MKIPVNEILLKFQRESLLMKRQIFGCAVKIFFFYNKIMQAFVIGKNNIYGVIILSGG
jgi:hypothetical protein